MLIIQLRYVIQLISSKSQPSPAAAAAGAANPGLEARAGAVARSLARPQLIRVMMANEHEVNTDGSLLLIS